MISSLFFELESARKYLRHPLDVKHDHEQNIISISPLDKRNAPGLIFGSPRLRIRECLPGLSGVKCLWLPQSEGRGSINPTKLRLTANPGLADTYIYRVHDNEYIHQNIIEAAAKLACRIDNSSH